MEAKNLESISSYLVSSAIQRLSYLRGKATIFRECLANYKKAIKTYNENMKYLEVNVYQERFVPDDIWETMTEKEKYLYNIETENMIKKMYKLPIYDDFFTEDIYDLHFANEIITHYDKIDKNINLKNLNNILYEEEGEEINENVMLNKFQEIVSIIENLGYNIFFNYKKDNFTYKYKLKIFF